MNSKKDLIEIILLGSILVVLVFILALTGIKTKLENNSNNSSNNIFPEENINDATNNEENNLDNNNGNVENNNSNSDKNSNNNSSTEEGANNNENNTSNNNASNNTTNNNSNDLTNNNVTDSNTNNNTSNSNPSTDNNNNNSEQNNDKVNITESENSVISYFTGLEKQIEIYNNENDKTFREKAKNIFTTTVDFLFYDGEIKGYTFDELSLATKLKVLKITASIDNKIDSYFPNYKDTIKEKATNLKGKIAVLYLETTNKFCAKVGEESCNVAREDFNNMKTSFGYTWSILKDVLTISKDKLSLVLSEWYKSIK